MRLAREFGIPLRRLEREFGSREIQEWIALHEIEPWGEERADLRNALLCCVVANCLESLRVTTIRLNSKRKPKPHVFKVQDFLFDFENVANKPKTLGKRRRKGKQTWEEQLSIAKMITEALGGKDLRPGANLGLDPYGGPLPPPEDRAYRIS